MRIQFCCVSLLAAILTLPLAGTTIRLSSDWGKYQLSESSEINITATVTDLPEKSLRAEWELSDLTGTIIDSGSWMVDTTPHRLPLTLPDDGYYRLRVTLKSESGASHGSTSTGLVKTVFQEKTGFDQTGRWAVNGHGRTEEYPVFRKLGITMSRLDISWKDVEPQPGHWKFESFDKIAVASHENGILILAILGKNPPWLPLNNGQGTDREQFLEYVRRTVTRYRNDIFFWDLWNEPQYSWSGTKEEFGLVMRDAYHIIKEIQPESTVVYNGHPFEEELRTYTLENLAPLNGEMPFDALGMHPYSRPRSPDNNRFLEHMSNIRTLLNRIAPGKALWISELGWPTSTDALGVTELEQAAYLQRAAMLGLAAGVEKFVWYMPYSSDNPAYHESQYGFFRADLTPKPALAAYAFLIRMLENMEFSREIPIGEAVRCLEFTNGSRKLHVLWATGETVKLTADWPEGIRIRRGDGSALKALPVMEIGALPVFLDGIDGSAALVDAHLSLARPLKLEGATLTSEGLQFILRNRTGRELPVEANLKLPPGLVFRNAAAATGMKFQITDSPKEIRIGLRFPAPPFSGNAVLTLRTPDAVQEETVPLRMESAVYGGESSPLQLNAISAIGPADMQKEWGGPEDLSCTAWFGWDEEGLLFRADVRDDEHRNTCDASQLWAEDSIQLAFRLVPGNVPDYYDEESVEIGAALTANGVCKAVYCGKPDLDFQADIIRLEEEKITRYRIRIPWKFTNLKTAPPPGCVISWNFAVNDVDRKGGRKWLEPAPGICLEKNPAKFPRFILKKETK